MENYAVEKSEPKRAKELQVVSEVSRFQRLTKSAHEITTELEKRLQSVLRDVPPSDKTSGGNIAELKVGLASVLATENDDLEFLIAKISSILDRLEI